MNIKESVTERARKLKADIPALFLSLQDKETPMMAKILAGVTVAYALSPVDLIPDFVPVLGYLDDIIILPALVALTLKLIPKEIYERNRRRAGDLWADKKPKIWYCAIPVILIWALIVWLVVKAAL